MITHERAIWLVKRCIDWIIEGAENSDARDELYAIGFSNDEIGELCYGYLLDVEGVEKCKSKINGKNFLMNFLT